MVLLVLYKKALPSELFGGAFFGFFARLSRYAGAGRGMEKWLT